jgi:phosphoribosyl 1,2-cyclic phosphate phosphodiesterase
MREESVLHAERRVVVTHFSHNIGLLHDDLAAIFAPDNIEVAYDGWGFVPLNWQIMYRFRPGFA